MIDNFGQNAEQHERSHERLHSVYWNKFIDYVEDAEGYYCSEQCVNDARGWVATAYSFFNQNSIYWNADFDINAYGADRRLERDQAAQAARQAAAQNEFFRQRLLNNNCEVWTSCPQ